MARPWNETAKDLQREAAISKILCRQGKGSDGWFKNPSHLHIDISLISKGRVISMIEIKCRKDASDIYDTAYISLIKISAALALEEATQLPIYFCWAWSDNIITLQRAKPPDFITITGNCRGQEGDQEPCGHYRIADMTRIGEETFL